MNTNSVFAWLFQMRQQQLRIQQQMNAPKPKTPAGPSGVAAQPYQKLNVITSKDAADIRSGSSASSSGGPIAPGPIVSKKAPKKVTKITRNFKTQHQE